MFNIDNIDINDCFIITPKRLEDYRGSFIKIFHSEFYLENKLRLDFCEQYYSISKPNVFRGMHFQYPPKDHAKVVTCIKGSVIDIIIDLRKHSKTFQKVFTVNLDEYNKKILYLPSGIAHGFYVTSKCDAMMLYNVTSVFSKEHDGGINYKSIKSFLPFNNQFIVSEKDKLLPLLDNFNSPF